MSSNNLQQLEQKLSSKAQIPTNPQHLISHFTRISEAFYEMASTMQSSMLSGKCQSLLELCLNYPFPFQQYRGCANAIASWIVAMAKLDGLWIVKCNDCLMTFITKKGVSTVGKNIAIEILYALLVLRGQLPPISFNTLIEVAQMTMKMIKASTEIGVRISLVRFMAPLIDEGVCSREAIRTEMVKYTLKFCQNDKSDVLRYEGARALVELLRKDVALAQNFEQMLLVANKLLLDAQPHISRQAVEALCLLNHKQVDVEHLIAHQLLVKKQEKKNPVPPMQVLLPKEYVTKLFGNFNDSLLRATKPTLILQTWQRSLAQDIDKYGQVIARGACEVVINAIVGTNSEDPQLPYLERDASRTCQHLVQRLQRLQLCELLEYLLEKVKSLAKLKANHVYVAKLLLACIKSVSDILGAGMLSEKMSKPNQLIDQIGSVLALGTLPNTRIHHISTPINVSCEVEFVEVMKSFFVQNAKWQQSILSVLLNLTTIYTADLGVQLTTHAKTANLLRGHALCLTKLVSLMDVDVHSTPLELTGQLWDTARALVMGHTVKMKSPTKILPKFEGVTPSNCMQKETGWLIMAELLSVGFVATQQKLKEVLAILQDSMSYLTAATATSTADEHMMVAFGKIPLVVRRILMGPLQKHLSENMHKFLAQQMIAWYQCLLKSEVKIERNNNTLITAKAQAFKTFACIPAKAYSSHINALVQIAVDDVLIAGSAWEDVTLEELRSGEFMEACDEMTLALAICDFFAQIMNTNGFTTKNKVNLVKYWQSNLLSLLASQQKEACKPQKAIPYLLIVRRVQEALLSGEGDILNDASFVGCLLSCIEACSPLSGSRIVKQLVGETYSQHLALRQVDREGMLNKFLQAQNPVGSTFHVVSFMISKQRLLKEDPQDTLTMQLQNLYVKLASQPNTDDLREMLYEVSALLDHQDTTPAINNTTTATATTSTTQNLTKGTFIFLAFSQMALQRSTDYSDRDLLHLASIMLNYFRNTRVVARSPLLTGTYLQTLLGDVKILLLQNASSPANQVLLARLEYYSSDDATQLLRYLKLFRQLQLRASPERWDLVAVFNDILRASGTTINIEIMSLIYVALNHEFKLQHMPEKEDPHAIPMKQLKKVFMRAFHHLLSHAAIHQQIQYLQDYILEEHVQDKEPIDVVGGGGGEGKNTETLVTSEEAKQQMKVAIENHSRTRLFLLQRVNKLFTKFDARAQPPDDLVTATNHIFTYLFKASTSHFEEIRDVAYKIFFTFFQVVLPFDENGRPQSLPLNHRSCLLRSFAAQIDAVLSDTIKREDLNTPQTNNLNMTLIVKFFKIVLTTDTSLAKKMVNFLARGLDNGLTLKPSPFYSEKGMTLQMIQRIHSIGKILKYLQSCSSMQVSDVFSTRTLSLLHSNVVVLLQDTFIVLCTSRSQIKSYSKFRFVYNGSRSSYDPALFFQRLPNLLEVYINVKQFNLPDDDQFVKIMPPPEQQQNMFLSLVMFMLTQNVAIENIAKASPEDDITYIAKGLRCLLLYIKAFPLPVDGTLQLLDMLMEYSLIPVLQSTIVQIVCQFATNTIPEYVQPLSLALNYLYVSVHERQEKTLLIKSLIEVCVEPQRTIFLVWQHLKDEEDLPQIKKLINVVASLQSSSPDYVMLAYIDELLLHTKPTQSQLFQLFGVYAILNIAEYVDKVNNFIDSNLLSIMSTAKLIIARDRNVDATILSTMMPAVMRQCLATKTTTNPTYAVLVESVKFILTVYAFSVDNWRMFTPTLRILLLFLDPLLAQHQELLQVTQQAIKHIINITDVQLIRSDVMTYPDKLKMMVMGMYQQAAHEEQLRAQQEAAAKQQREQHVEQGTIKLKLFGQK